MLDFSKHEDRKHSPLPIGSLPYNRDHTLLQKTHRLKDLLLDCEVISLKGDKSVLIDHIAVDSRRVLPQSLFFAIPGFRQDGHYFLEDALKRGAVALVTDQKLKLLPAVILIQVKDVRAVLAKVARTFYQKPDQDLSLIGITGTNGKTTVSFLVQSLLKTQVTPVGLLGTIHYDLGKRTIPAHRTTPDALELYGLLHQIKQNGCKHVVMEVSSHGIDQKRISSLHFEVGAFLNLTQDHLDYHGSMEDYFQTKLRLFTEGSYPKKVAVNINDPYGQRLLELLPKDVEALPFGTSERALLRAQDIVLSPKGSSFRVMYQGTAVNLSSPLVGQYNVHNVLAALSILQLLGKTISEAAEGLKEFSGVPGRLEKVEAGQSYTVLVDYAHTDDALHHMLASVRAITKGKLLVVFGCGGDRDKLKRSKMTAAVQAYADHAWATSDNPRSEAIASIFEDMKNGILYPEKISFEACRKTAIDLALKAANTEHDTVVIAGKGHETYQEFQHTVIPFDDRRVAKERIQAYRSRLLISHT